MTCRRCPPTWYAPRTPPRRAPAHPPAGARALAACRQRSRRTASGCAQVEQMSANPYETESDSFYYVGDTMIMHNKAKYAYTEDGRQ